MQKRQVVERPVIARQASQFTLEGSNGFLIAPSAQICDAEREMKAWQVVRKFRRSLQRLGGMLKVRIGEVVLSPQKMRERFSGCGRGQTIDHRFDLWALQAQIGQPQS